MTSNIAMQWVWSGLTQTVRRHLAEAEPLYLRALDADQDFYPALHLMGVLRLQQDRATEALPYIQRALDVQPNMPETLANYGIEATSRG